MNDSKSQPEGELIERALGGDVEALAEAFDHYRSRLRCMVMLRLNPRLHRRVDASDILQETFMDLTERLPAFSEKRDVPFFLWLRRVTGRRIDRTHRRHLDVAKRDAGLEVSLDGGRMPSVSGASLASRLAASMTSASGRAMRAEAETRTREVLNSLEPVDREILSLRHIEELSNSEAAIELGLKESTAGMRYLRALKRLREALDAFPELRPEP